MEALREALTGSPGGTATDWTATTTTGGDASDVETDPDDLVRLRLIAALREVLGRTASAWGPVGEST